LEDALAQSPLHWRRGPRASFSLGDDKGVYALFLREGSLLPGIEVGESRLLYIGLPGDLKGFEGRCHFTNARTANHSPRKSLAVLLMDELSLTPVLVRKPNPKRDTWGLDAASDARLSEWMHAHLDLAIEPCSDPAARETELVRCYAPPLNLNKCVQSAQHRRIKDERKQVMDNLRSGNTHSSQK
jgi:hypothetical protein